MVGNVIRCTETFHVTDIRRRPIQRGRVRVQAHICWLVRIIIEANVHAALKHKKVPCIYKSLPIKTTWAACEGIKLVPSIHISQIHQLIALMLPKPKPKMKSNKNQ